MAKRFLTPINVLNAASDPGTATEGDLYYNTSTDKLKIYSNSAWVDVSSGGGSGVTSLTGTANEIDVSASTGAVTISLPATINANTTGSAASLTTARAIALSGDVSGSANFDGSASAGITTTLANTAVTPASYGSASAVGTFTVDSKGRLTAASNTAIAIAQSAVTNLTTDLAAKAPLASPTFTGTVALPITTHSGVATFSDYLNRTTANGNSAWLQQDGTGRVHWYWNTLGGTSPTFTNANEDASALTLHITNNGNGGTFFHRSANGQSASAGGAITWTTTLYVDLNTITYKGTPIALTASPALTGTPTAPTAAVDTNTTQIATTAYVVGQGYLKSSTASSTYAPLASPTFTGTVTAATLDLTTAATATAATSYWVETGSDGILRPKTLANTRTEIVTTAAVNAAAATTVGTVTSGTWNATNIALNRGGTNASLTAVNGGVIYSTATAFAITAAGTAGQVLTSNGAAAPTWQAAAGGSAISEPFFLAGL